MSPCYKTTMKEVYLVSCDNSSKRKFIMSVADFTPQWDSHLVVVKWLVCRCDAQSYAGWSLVPLAARVLHASQAKGQRPYKDRSLGPLSRGLGVRLATLPLK